MQQEILLGIKNWQNKKEARSVSTSCFFFSILLFNYWSIFVDKGVMDDRKISSRVWLLWYYWQFK